MKQFGIVFAAVFMATVLALLGYDEWIVKPREKAQVEAVQLDLGDAETKAKNIAKNLDTAVAQSVENAGNTMNMQADEMRQRALAADAIARASLFKTALSEYFMSMGKWPESQSEAGLAAPESYAGGAVASISVVPQGMVVIRLNNQIENGAKILLVPEANAQSYAINWHCRTEGSEKARRLLPDCR